MSRTKRYGFKLEQSDKVLAISEISLTNIRKRESTAAATADEHSSFRGVVGSLHYVAANTRPDLSAAASILQGVASRPTVEHLMEANKELRMAQEHDEVAIYIEPIASGRLLFSVFTDAAWANRYDGSSQGGYLIVAHDAAMLDGKTVTANPVDWASRKLHRVARSSLSAELQSNTNGLDSLAFALLMYADITTCCKSGQRSACGPAAEIEAKRHAGAVVMDHTGLYDIYSGKRLQLEEKRSQVEAQSNLESISTFGVRPRWVAGIYQLADAPTKRDRQNGILREYLRRSAWSLSYDPNFVAGAKLKAKVCTSARNVTTTTIDEPAGVQRREATP